MRISPLELTSYYIEQLSFAMEEGFVPGEERVEIVPPELLLLEVQSASNPDDAREIMYQLRVELAAGSGLPYAFHIVLAGFFRIGADVPSEQAAAMADANAPAVLYGSAREAIAAATGRGPFPPLALPSVHFLDLQRAAQTDEAKPAAKKRAVKSGKLRAVKNDSKTVKQ